MAEPLSRVEKRQIKMADYYQQLEALSEDIPKELATKMKVMARLLGLIGEYWAEAQGELGKVRAQRKYAFAVAKGEIGGTIAEREAHAWEVTRQLHEREEALEAEVLRWEKAYNSQQELINVYKLDYKGLLSEYNGKIET